MDNSNKLLLGQTLTEIIFSIVNNCLASLEEKRYFGS
jgi:hypothetical protein